LQSGSESAFQRLFEGLQSPVCHFLANTLGIPESDVDDVYVDALMKVHENIQKFKCGGTAKLTTCIYGIARNVAIDYHRSSKKNQTPVEFDEATVKREKHFSRRSDKGWSLDASINRSK
jgi:DNA-directed RNA polymerase specialized sigma24 family protein